MALLGVTQGPGTVALVGRPARHAEALVAAVEGIHAVAVDPDLRSWSPVTGVSRMMSSPGLPLYSRSLRGVALDGRLGEPWIREAVRVVARFGRVVVTGSREGDAAILEDAGLQILASEGGTVVAARA